MDIGGWWASLTGALQQGWSRAMEIGEPLLANPLTRALALIVIVYFTIRVIAGVYSGDKQGAELGPVAIRPHTSARYGKDTVRMPHALMPMAMDGVSARCKVFYVYNDTRGRRRKTLVHEIRDARLSVSPVALPAITNIIYGQEIPEGVKTQHVCFPASDAQEPTTVTAAPELATDYAKQYRIIENWTEDDTAARVSVSADVKEEIADGKIQFIAERAARIAKADKGLRLRFKRLHENRPNCVGSYYLKFEFSREPLFVLTRHPDRDLKMTAWLTILTSMFALIMDWWPNGSAPFGLTLARAPSEVTDVVNTAGDHAPARSVRTPIVP